MSYIGSPLLKLTILNSFVYPFLFDKTTNLSLISYLNSGLESIVSELVLALRSFYEKKPKKDTKLFYEIYD